MGHDIQPIARHALNTQQVELLARDLSKRLQINIRFGYGCGGKEHLLGLLGRPAGEHFRVLGEYTVDPDAGFYRLTDDDYLSKEVVGKFGPDIMQDKRFWPDYYEEWPVGETLEMVKLNLTWNTYERYGPEHATKLTINNELYTDHFSYYSRWWQLCHSFQEGEFYELEVFMKFRKDLLARMRKLGGDTMYYLDDQSSVMKGIGQGEEGYMTWPAFEEFVIAKAGDLLLDIPRYFEDPQYKALIQSRREAEYALVFVDDFRDIL